MHLEAQILCVSPVGVCLSRNEILKVLIDDVDDDDDESIDPCCLERHFPFTFDLIYTRMGRTFVCHLLFLCFGDAFWQWILYSWKAFLFPF